MHGYFRGSLDLKLNGAYEYLLSFIQGGAVFEYSRQEDLAQPLMNRPARLWGVGMLIFVLSDAGYSGRINDFIVALKRYEYRPGRFRVNAEDDNFYPRVQGHVALGVILYEASE